MNWDYQKEEYNEQTESDPVWHLERLINYGLGKEKINRAMLETYLPQLDIPEERRNFLELLVIYPSVVYSRRLKYCKQYDNSQTHPPDPCPAAGTVR